MLSHDEFAAIAGKINYQYRHPHFLYALVKWLRPKTIVEVGTHIGMSAVWMARGCQENGEGHLYCIDSFCWTWENQEQQWKANVTACQVESTITLLSGRSQEVDWPKQIDMAYIDGNHTYDVCKHDCEKAMEAGASCLVLNDASSSIGVYQVSSELKIYSKQRKFNFIEAYFDCGLLVMLKKPHMSEGEIATLHGNFDEWDKGA